MLAYLPAQAQYVTLTGKIQASNGAPASDYTLTFQPTQAMTVPTTGLIVPNSTNCATTTDGTVVGLPNPLLPVTATPQFTGTLPPGNYYVEITYRTAAGLTTTLVGPETQVQLTSTGGLTIQPPPNGIPSGATGMGIYIGAASGQETYQGQSNGNSPWVQSVPLAAGSSPPTANNTVCQQVANDAAWPTGTGYRVTLLDPTGNVQPSYPMTWQLLGPNSTINLSSGLPLYNGVTIYPTPIQANPSNHLQQSISSDLNFNGYNILNVGSITACTTNGIIHANCLGTFGDIGAKINAAIAQCGQACTVTVDAGNYSFTTPVVVPMNLLGTLSLAFDPAAVLHYNGTGCAVNTTINTANPTVVNLRISGGQLYGNANALCGYHIQASNGTWIDKVLVSGFTAGQGVWYDGANAAWLTSSLIQGNQQGVYATNTICNGNVCGPTVTGADYSPNAIHIVNNDIPGNSQWGVQFFDTYTNGATGALNNSIENNDLEGNGSAGSQYGAISVGRSTNMVISRNYFEGSPRQIVLGFPSSPGVFFSSRAAVIRDNYFTILNTTPYEIELQDAVDATIEGNGTTAASIQNSGACFLNETETTGTFYGKNSVVTTASGSSGSVSPLCQAGTAEQRPAGTGSYAQLNSNYFPFLSYLNFTITAAASDTQAAQFVQPGNSCFATSAGANPTAYSNAQAIIAQVYVIPGTNQFTIYHPTGQAGLQYTIWCSGVPN